MSAQEIIAELPKLKPDVEIIAAEPGLFDRGCQLYTSRPDKEWSLTDCISLCAIQERGLEEALTHDRHFEQAGFRALWRG